MRNHMNTEDYRSEREWLNNRQKIHSHDGRGGYCPSCDATIVRKGQKCPVCKNVNGIVRRKKLPKNTILY